jgi:oligoendopeptidase F
LSKLLLAPIAALLLCSSLPAAAQSDTPTDPQATWNLTDLYPSEAAWNQAREEVLADFDKIDARRGTLGDSAESLYETHRLVSDILKKGRRVYVYASLQGDEDLRDSAGQERNQLGQIMFARFGEVTACIQP